MCRQRDVCTRHAAKRMMSWHRTRRRQTQIFRFIRWMNWRELGKWKCLIRSVWRRYWMILGTIHRRTWQRWRVHVEKIQRRFRRLQRLIWLLIEWLHIDVFAVGNSWSLQIAVKCRRLYVHSVLVLPGCSRLCEESKKEREREKSQNINKNVRLLCSQV